MKRKPKLKSSKKRKEREQGYSSSEEDSLPAEQTLADKLEELKNVVAPAKKTSADKRIERKNVVPPAEQESVDNPKEDEQGDSF